MLGLLFDKMRKDAKRKVLQNLNGESIIAADGRVAFLIDTSQNLLYVVNENNQLNRYRKDDILEIKVEDENEKGHKRSLFSTLVWYQIGKLIDRKNDLHEVLPHIVTEKEIVKVKKILLRLNVKDFNNPYYDLLVFENGFAADKKQGYNLATRWYSLINVLKHK